MGQLQFANIFNLEQTWIKTSNGFMQMVSEAVASALHIQFNVLFHRHSKVSGGGAAAILLKVSLPLATRLWSSLILLASCLPISL
jgi:hypothetical protein